MKDETKLSIDEIKDLMIACAIDTQNQLRVEKGQEPVNSLLPGKLQDICFMTIGRVIMAFKKYEQLNHDER